MQAPEPGPAQSLKQRALEEFKAYWVITLYLWLFLGCFTVYRRLVLAETGAPYLHYGIALIEALAIAKVVLIGRIFGFSRRFDHLPLIVQVIYKALLFALLVLLFGLLRKTLDGLIRCEGLAGGLHRIADVGRYEIGARKLMLTVAFVPFFAISEVARVLGREELVALFFARRGEAPDAAT